MHRRQFLLGSSSAAIATAALGPTLFAAAGKAGRPPRILLRNAWQSQNIGDIAHYLGFLELLERFRIAAEVRLWPSNLENGADALLARRFPNVRVVATKEAIATAFRECDFFVHGSSAGFGAANDAARWHRETGKPYGVMGITLSGVDPRKIEIASKADFVFFRESRSLERAKQQGCAAPLMAFGPDTAFGVVTLRNDRAATAFLRAHGLEEGKFMCCIPRWRITPHWLIDQRRSFSETTHRRNEAMKEHDHAQLRAAIIAVTRETDLKVLVCHEDQTQIQLGKAMLVDPLPEDVKRKVVWRDRFWLTDEALSTYVRSAGLFGNEMHSPIMCIASGIPALVCRFADQTEKGFMWHDIGLHDWLFDLDRPDEVARIAPTVLAMAKDPAAARAKAARARDVVLGKQREEMAALAQSLARVS
jgi:polysaccharide pyruvyl transferase WcaK-like protein